MQLKMRRYSQPVKERPLPDGFAFLPFDGSDKAVDEWVRLCNFGLVPGADREIFDKTIRNFPNIVAERDCFFVVDSEGRYAATSTAVATPEGVGLVHMVASDPAIRGKGLGHAMLAHVLEMLEEREMKTVELRTDDERLAAIKTYLDAGFLPVLLDDPDGGDHAARWDKVREALSYASVEYVKE